MLDVRTLIFSVVAANVICFLAMAVLYIGRVPVKGPLLWAQGKLLNSLGLFLVFLRGYIPDFASIVVANGFLILWAIFEWRGFRQFLGINRYGLSGKVVLWGSVPLVMAALYWFSALDSSLWVRRAIVSFFFSFLSLLVVRDLIAYRSKTAAVKFATAVYLVHCIIMLCNLTLSFSLRPETNSLFLASGLYNSLLFLYSMLSTILGTFAMILLVSQELQRRLEKQATLDPLTGVYNRLALEMFGKHAFAQMKRSGKPFAALMIDLDHFKRINDAKGHAVGDRLLCHFTSLVVAVVRSDDFLFRYGGEEFVVLVPEADFKGGVTLAERIRIACQSSPLNEGKELVYFSVSIGLALAGMDDKCVYDAINRADEAMYEAKNAGRNKVVAHDPDAGEGFIFLSASSPLIQG